MPGPISIGDLAPNFDLSSTENAVLMLKDEIIRTAVVLYFFADLESDRVRRDLDALNRSREGLRKLTACPLAISPAKLDDLKKLQAERQLYFPLLHDDRNFSAAYGVVPSGEGKPVDPALVVVDRCQEVSWLAYPVVSVEGALPQVEKLLRGLPSPTRSYSKKVINRWVDRFAPRRAHSTDPAARERDASRS